jgi:uncharacterized protein (DUF2225 family)
MTWEIGKQKYREKEDINKVLSELGGYLDEKEAQVLLYKFLRENITFTTNLIAGVDLFPFQHLAIKGMFETDYFLGIWSRGLSKSFTTAIYAFLDAIFNPGVQIGILSATFRQSKMIFEKIEDIANKPEAAFLSQCITKKSKKNDQYTLEIGDSRIIALPLGDGSKLRGFRFHRIIIDEFLLMPEQIYNEVILPFLSVVQNPTEREKRRKIEDKLIGLGKMKEEDRYQWPSNKLIMLSSASYKFEYMYKLYERFENLILNGPQAGDEGDASRAIMHFGYDIAPQDLYDRNLIDQSKATMSQSQFDREFNSIFTDDSSGYFKTSKMKQCTVSHGDSPCTEIVGERGAKYLLAFDPSWAETESSDDFAIQVFKLNDSTKQGVLVHGYAVPGLPMRNHIQYMHYVISNFNIVAIVGDYNGGVQFIQAANSSDVFKNSGLEINEIRVGLDSQEKYQQELIEAKNQYNINDKRICILRKPTSQWIRQANELLQSNLDHKKVWFASRATDSDFRNQINKNIPVDKLKFFSETLDQGYSTKKEKMIDFVEHQFNMMNYTKEQLSLIQLTTSTQGTATFGLPQNLKRQTGPGKTRKDSYSAMVLGNWMIKIYYDMLGAQQEEVTTTFTPMMF